MGQFKDLMRAQVESYRRVWALSLDIAHGVSRDADTETAHVIRPLVDHEARYLVRFKDMPVIGWVLSVLGFAVNFVCRLLMVPIIGWGAKWPRLNIPKCWG